MFSSFLILVFNYDFILCVASEKKVKELEDENQRLKIENQRLNTDLSHELGRHSLYKQEVRIMKKNEQIKLAEFRNKIHLQVCDALRIPTSCFPTLQEKVDKRLPSVVCDSDFEDDFSDHEPEVQEHDESGVAKNMEENKGADKIDDNIAKDVNVPKE